MLPALLLLSLAASPVDQRREQDQAWAAVRSGRVLPLKEIEHRVLPTMPRAQYLGVEFDAETAVYTLKFLRDGAVIWVQVDGRTGQVVGRTGR